MAKIIPFKAVRPTRKKVHLVSSRPFYTYKKSHLKAKLESNPYSFLHVINPEFSSVKKNKSDSIQRFELIKKKYEYFKNKKYFIQDKKPVLYVYRQTTSFGVFTGLIAGSSVKDYQTNKIKKHENTIIKREKIFKKYLEVCNFHAEPVLLSYNPTLTIKELILLTMTKRPEYEFTTTDKKSHEIWLIDNISDIEKITKEFKSLNNIYIADGHHRIASSSLYQISNSKNDKSNYFLSFLIDQKDLKIFEFNRIVKDIGEVSNDNFLKEIKNYFLIENLKNHKSPIKKDEIVIYLDKKWYLLTVNINMINPDFKSSLNSQMVSDLILNKVLNIKNLNDRIEYVRGNQSIKILTKKVDQKKRSLGIELFPHKIEEIIKIADLGQNMPPKSTWIEPKLRSGLTIYEY